MPKWKEIKTYTEVNPYNGQPADEDAPANSVAGGGVALPPDAMISRKKKKKTLIDARSKSYKQHRERLEKARAKREERKSKLAQKVAENTKEFEREKYIEEVELDEVKISSYIVGELRDIVKNKSAKNLKFKDGQLKVDMTTANMMLQVLDKVKTETKRKIMDVLDRCKKNDFMKVHGLVMKAVR